MRIGYPGRNLTLALPAPPSIRPDTYDPMLFAEVVAANLDAIEATLRWNADHGIRYYRLSTWTVPFASHPVVDIDWRSMFGQRLEAIGACIHAEGMRLTVHPGQYIRLTSPEPEVVHRSVAELAYHAALFDLMGLDGTHKVQIHTGVPGEDKRAEIDRFVEAWHDLPADVGARLAIENDERLFSLADNLEIHHRTGVPLVFDTFHHRLYNHGEPLAEALALVQPTWQGHGPAMIDYSTQDPAKAPGAHAASIEPDDFAAVYPELARHDVDVMLEIKDKEASVLVAMRIAGLDR